MEQHSSLLRRNQGIRLSLRGIVLSLRGIGLPVCGILVPICGIGLPGLGIALPDRVDIVPVCRITLSVGHLGLRFVRTATRVAPFPAVSIDDRIALGRAAGPGTQVAFAVGHSPKRGQERDRHSRGCRNGLEGKGG